jgi:hypothetical protein
MENNIHLIRTDKFSKLQLERDGGLHLEDGQSIALKSFQNIYITDNSEIKEGDYYIDFTSDGLKIDHFKTKDDWVLVGICGSKKIILTTNQDLIKVGIQSISNEFLQWFVKNPSCERVEVSYGLLKPFQSNYVGYMIHLPDNDGVVEPKQYPSIQCDEACFYHCTKGGTQDPDCEREEPKQETLEEVAERIVRDAGIPYDFSEELLEIAKWQAERMYSEEEVKKIAEEVRWQAIGDPIEFTKNFNKWFSQFKKQNNEI